MKTDTPRTDEVAWPETGLVEGDFARQLERELTAVTEQRDRLAEALNDVMNSGDSTTMYRTAKVALRSLNTNTPDQERKSPASDGSKFNNPNEQ
jgi:hypothetical protein